MRPLVRNLLIGIVAALCVLAAAAGAWWYSLRGTDTLADRLPAESVLAYTTSRFVDMRELYPDLPPVPDREAGTEATALVRTADGTLGWMTLVRDGGRVRVHGSNPALEPLLKDERPSLGSNATFNAVRRDDGDWAYIASPRKAPGVEYLVGPLLALDTPVSFRSIDGGFELRLPLRPTPRVAGVTGRPIVSLPDAEHVLRIPSWNALAAMAPLFSEQAATVGETLASTFLADIAPGTSLRYDAAILLHAPSLLQIGNADGRRTFALEGTGRTAADTERLLALLHERFGAARGASSVKTTTVEGYAINTLTREGGADTTATTDGPWSVLDTRAGDDALVSGRDGARFAITNEPDAFYARAESTDDVGDESTIRWTAGASARLSPLAPGLDPFGDGLHVRLTDGPGYVEWSVRGL